MARSSAKRATPSLLDAPEVRTTLVASVALLRPVDKLYSYRIPTELADRVRPGMRVTVPFGRQDREATAFCVSVSTEPWQSTLKPVLGLVDETPLLDGKALELGRWVARYYGAHLVSCQRFVVPIDFAKCITEAAVRLVKRGIIANSLFKIVNRPFVFLNDFLLQFRKFPFVVFINGFLLKLRHLVTMFDTALVAGQCLFFRRESLH